MTARAVVRRTADAADELLLWLNSQRRNSPASSGDAGVSAPLDAVAAIAGTGPIDIPPTCDRLAASDAGGPVRVRPPPALGPPLGPPLVDRFHENDPFWGIPPVTARIVVDQVVNLAAGDHGDTSACDRTFDRS
jgi:hypothetical protein